MGGVEGHNAHAGFVELEVHIHEDLLEGIDDLLDGGGLNCLDLEEEACGGLGGRLGVHCGVGEGSHYMKGGDVVLKCGCADVQKTLWGP